MKAIKELVLLSYHVREWNEEERDFDRVEVSQWNWEKIVLPYQEKDLEDFLVDRYKDKWGGTPSSRSKQVRKGRGKRNLNY
jgi:hypothetical protein